MSNTEFGTITPWVDWIRSITEGYIKSNKTADALDKQGAEDLKAYCEGTLHSELQHPMGKAVWQVLGAPRNVASEIKALMWCMQRLQPKTGTRIDSVISCVWKRDYTKLVDILLGDTPETYRQECADFLRTQQLQLCPEQ